MPPESLFSFSYLSPLTFLKKYKPMKSNVTDRLSEYFPGHFPDEPVEDEYLFYRFLHHLGIYCADRFGQPESRRVLDSFLIATPSKTSSSVRWLPAGVPRTCSRT
jgi:hypothetical protein